MISRKKYKDVLWIDLESPSKEEVDELMRDYGIHPLVSDALLTPTRHSGVDVYKESIYLVLHFPIFYDNHDDQKQEVDFVIGKDFLITTRYEKIDPLHAFSKHLEDPKHPYQNNEEVTHGGVLFFYMIRHGFFLSSPLNSR
jgi:magnesium transporter